MNLNKLFLISFAAALLSFSATAEAQAPAAATPPTKAALTKTDLRKLMENTDWTVGANEDNHVFFLRNGEMTGIGAKYYTVEAPDILRLYQTDPKKDRKAEFTQYRVNVSAMVAEGDAEGSTKLGSKGKPMKYVGPIKGKK